MRSGADCKIHLILGNLWLLLKFLEPTVDFFYSVDISVEASVAGLGYA